MCCREKMILLSYPISLETPQYGTLERGFQMMPIKQIDKGDSCNTCNMVFNNHLSTHIDAPNHFYNKGRKIADYSLNELWYKRPQIINIELLENELCKKSNLEGKIKDETDFLIINTGWGRYRNETKYVMENPGIDPEVAHWIHEQYQNIRAIGVDFISISSFKQRKKGREAHLAFLDPSKEILIVEDMNLNDCDNINLQSILIVPFNIKGIDSAPCTVLGIEEEN